MITISKTKNGTNKKTSTQSSSLHAKSLDSTEITTFDCSDQQKFIALISIDLHDTDQYPEQIDDREACIEPVGEIQRDNATEDD